MITPSFDTTQPPQLKPSLTRKYHALILEKSAWIELDNCLSTQTKTAKKNFIIQETLSVLLIEDDPIAQKIHTKLLVEAGCKVDLAKNAESALAMADIAYDLVLVDISLPDKNGIEVAAEIRYGRNKNKNTKIVAVTAYATESVRRKCLGAGIDYVFSKPIHAEQIGIILDIIHTKNNVEKNNDECLKNPKIVRKIKQNLIQLYPKAVENAPQPENMSDSQYINYLAIQLLEETGNEFPTQKAISFVEGFLKRYHKKLSKIEILTEVEQEKKKIENILELKKKTFFTLQEAEYSIYFLEKISHEEISAFLGISIDEATKIFNQLQLKLSCKSSFELRKKLTERLYGSLPQQNPKNHKNHKKRIQEQYFHHLETK